MGGGVAILCKNDWTIKIYHSATDFECLWCSDFVENSDYFIEAVYNPPNPTYNEPDVFDYLTNTCEKIISSDPNARIIIGGDINKLNVTKLIAQHSLQQMVKSPTRGEQILDVFLTNYCLLWRKPIVFKAWFVLIMEAYLYHLVLPLGPCGKMCCFWTCIGSYKWTGS